MRRTIAIILVLLSADPAWAQETEYRSRVELGLVIGYQFGGAVDNTVKHEGEDIPGTSLGLPGSALIGIIADVRLAPKLMLEVSYDRQDTRLDFHDPASDTVTVVSDLRMHVLQAGLMYVWSAKSTQLFTGGTIGFTDMVPRENLSNERRFSAGLLFGAKGFVSKYFGFRGQTRLLITNMPKNDELFCSPEGICYEHEINSFMTNINLSLGIFIAL